LEEVGWNDGSSSESAGRSFLSLWVLLISLNMVVHLMIVYLVLRYLNRLLERMCLTSMLETLTIANGSTADYSCSTKHTKHTTSPQQIVHKYIVRRGYLKEDGLRVIMTTDVSE
jgi:hypothetical protein